MDDNVIHLFKHGLSPRDANAAIYALDMVAREYETLASKCEGGIKLGLLQAAYIARNIINCIEVVVLNKEAV